MRATKQPPAQTRPALARVASRDPVTGTQLVAAVAVILTVHCARTASAARKSGCLAREPTPFQAASEPELGIRDYLTQLRKLVRCSRECFVLALIYIDRLVERCPETVVSNVTVQRLLLTSILVASKFLDDKGCDNADYAKAGGLTTAEMNHLEDLFVRRLDWRFRVQQNEYEWYRDLACRAVAVSS